MAKKVLYLQVNFNAKLAIIKTPRLTSCQPTDTEFSLLIVKKLSCVILCIVIGHAFERVLIFENGSKRMQLTS